MIEKRDFLSSILYPSICPRQRHNRLNARCWFQSASNGTHVHLHAVARALRSHWARISGFSSSYSIIVPPSLRLTLFINFPLVRNFRLRGLKAMYFAGLGPVLKC